jgi:hypothetical protein
MQVRLIGISLTIRNGRLHLPQLAVTIHDVVDGGAAAMRTFLRDVGYLISWVECEFAIVWFQFTEEHGK